MKISILTPSFNSGRYLERAIQSVLGQNDPDFEHIIVDGNSTDETLTVLKKYPHLKWISEPDRGQSDAMNKAFALSSGEIVAYLNADDWYEAGVIAHVRDCFLANPEADMVIGNFYSRDAQSSAVRLVVPEKDYRSILLFFRNIWPLNPVCYFYRRTVQEAVGEFPLGEHFSMDYWFLIRAMFKSRIHCSELVFGTFLSSPDSKTSRLSKVADREEQVLRSAGRVRQHLQSDNPQLLTWWNAQWLWHRYFRELPERVKSPIRYLAYYLLFAKDMTYGQYKELGFWRSRRKRLGG